MKKTQALFAAWTRKIDFFLAQTTANELGFVLIAMNY